MFDKLRRAFREAVDNFERELSRDDVGGAVDRLLAAMRDEATEAKARLAGLEEARRSALEEADREAAEVATCRRRERMARDIGDEETARVAAEYAARHEEREGVLRRKGEALDEEIRLRRGEVEEMILRIREARENRAGLAAQAGRSSARESIGGARDLFDELDRMAEEIEDTDRERAAAEAVDRHLDPTDDYDLRVDLDAPPRPEPDLDARLEELKRRMGRE